MTIVSASTIIAAQPAKVRETFLDFPNITTWDHHYVTALIPLSPDGQQLPDKLGSSLQPNDRLHAEFWGGQADLVVLENSARCLQWRGVWHGLIAVRSFVFEDDGCGGTKFTQSEEATGFMGGVLTVDGWFGGNLKKKFEVFNDDLKVFCEKAS